MLPNLLVGISFVFVDLEVSLAMLEARKIKPVEILRRVLEYFEADAKHVGIDNLKRLADSDDTRHSAINFSL